MKESVFQKWVVDVAKRFGWRVWHVPSPMRSADRGRGWVGAREAAGLPDLIMIHEDPPKLIFAELKGTSGSLSVEQAEFLRLANLVAHCSTIEHGIDWTTLADNSRPIGVYLWKPGDERAIESILRSKVLM